MGSSIGGIVGGLFGGDAPNAPNVKVFQPGGIPTADQQYQNLTTNRATNNPYAAYTPQATATFNSQYNNPYAGAYQTAANKAGAQFGTVGANDAAASSAMFGAGNTALDASNRVLQMGMDPQNALYQRTLQQLNDQVNATEATRGITSSPYGASVSNTANSNFNIDWQNNQLTRAIQALGGYTGGVAGAGNSFNSGNELGTKGGIATQLSGQMPYSATNDIAGNQAAALQALFGTIGNSGAGQWDTNTLSQLASYLNLGASQSNEQGMFDFKNYEAALGAYNADQQATGGMIGSILGGVGGAAQQNPNASNPASTAAMLAMLAA